ncbi:hypothetical protein BRCON_1970 [Candidatus Sumerlaea chitinivorans]|uniref:Alginate export domain-containing protein n=1 Tax=Sumerlaea chitinivorans TaxID=2250252 RepID=A0A2Z4Y694_SUMC1|nr:hypothetical protein BRCON_1970 [Candidatus Sumerlaea chitinivorans]
MKYWVRWEARERRAQQKVSSFAWSLRHSPRGVPRTPILLVALLLASAAFAQQTTTSELVASPAKREAVSAPNAQPAAEKKAEPIVGEDRQPAKKAPAVTAETKQAPKPEEREHLLPPLVWGQNDEWKLQFGGSVQFRNEYRHNFDMRSEISDNDHLSFVRTYINLDLTYREIVRVFFETLDARVWDENVDRMATDHWDVQQFFVELKDAPKSPWTLRLGRQRLPIISEGYVWGLPPVEYYWWNFVPVFDGAMLDYKTKDVQTHIFLLQPLTFARIRDGVMTTGHASELNRTWHYGIYSQLKKWAPHTVDLFFLGLSDQDNDRTWPAPNLSEQGRNGTTNRYTVGTALRGPIRKYDSGTLGYGLATAYQFGNWSNNDIRAWMLHADINYTWEHHPWKPKLTLLTNIASGDRKPGDDVNNRFNPLYGASHYGYGVIDFFRLSNIRQIGVTYAIKPHEKVKLVAEYHHFWLDSRTDAWGSPIGMNFGRDPSGNSGRDAGDEVDLTLTYTHSKRWQSELGFAYFFPGNFAKKQGRDDGAHFLFLQTIYKF